MSEDNSGLLVSYQLVGNDQPIEGVIHRGLPRQQRRAVDRELQSGSRLRTVVCVDADLLPLPGDKAVAHVLIEVAMGHETVPRDRQALCALINKYRGHRTQGDA
jgi:hypothetical protein